MRWLAAVGGSRFEGDDPETVGARADRFDDLLIAGALVRPHQEHHAKFAAEAHGSVNSQAFKRRRVANDDQFVASKYGSVALSKGLDSHVAAAGHDKKGGQDPEALHALGVRGIVTRRPAGAFYKSKGFRYALSPSRPRCIRRAA